MALRIDPRTQIALFLVLISVAPPALILPLKILGMWEEVRILQSIVILYGLSAILLSFSISGLILRNSEGELKSFMKSLTITLLLMVVYFLYLFASLLTATPIHIMHFLPYILAYFPLLGYGIRKLRNDFSFLTPRKLIMPIVVSCGILLVVLTSSLPQIIVFMIFLDIIVIFLFLSLTSLYLNTETVSYWAMISLAYLLQFPAKLYLPSMDFFVLPAMFYNLSLSVLLVFLYSIHNKKVRILSFETLEEERKKYATLLDRINEMKEAFRLMSRALRYDVLKKLQLISGFVEVYQLTKEEEYLEKAIKGVKECAEYIEKIDSLEKTVTTETATPKPIGMRNIVEEIKSRYEIPINVRGSCTALAGEDISVAIENVVENAVRHSGTDRIDILLSEIGDEAEIRVIDYGTGIPKEIKQELFKEGIRYGETAGLGFGLYIVKKIVEKYGGRVWVEDTKPRGTTVVIRLKTIQT